MDQVLLRFYLLCISLCFVCCTSHVKRREVVSVRSLTKRSVDGALHLHIRAFDEDHHLTLKEADDIFAPNFRQHSVEEDSDVLHDSAAAAKQDLGSGKFYVVEGGVGSLYIDNEDGLKVEGILDDKLRISPHPRRNDGSMEEDHVVYELEHEYEPLKNDYVIVDSLRTRETSGVETEGAMPSTVIVEVLVALDYHNCRALGFNDGAIRKYVGIFWNSVNKRYAAARNPSMRVAVSLLLAFKRPDQQPFIHRNRADDNHVDSKCLSDFKDYLIRYKGQLRNYDAAMLQMGIDGGSVSGGRWQDTMAGLAYVGAACEPGWNAGFAEDKAPSYNGVLTATHELAHILGVSHDGDGSSAGCPNGNGNIMATHLGGKNQWHFSSCSLATLRQFVRKREKSCLWNNSRKY